MNKLYFVVYIIFFRIKLISRIDDDNDNDLVTKQNNAYFWWVNLTMVSKIKAMNLFFFIFFVFC